jgi:hypothetical protein
MPRINARAMAEMIELPSYAQMRILSAQKYPSQGPAQFRRPYYAPAITGIRRAYTDADPAAAIQLEIAHIQSIGSASRRENLGRALNCFANSDQLTRGLVIQKQPKIISALGAVELRASPDLIATDEKNRRKLLYYHCKATSYDKEAAKRLIEIAHWLCEENEIEIPPKDIELIDLSNGVVHHVKTRRASTVKQMKQTAKVIEAIWDDL